MKTANEPTDAASPAAESPTAIQILHSARLSGQANLVHGFSTRTGGVSRIYRTDTSGDLNLGFTPQDDADHVRENRRRFLRALHAPSMRRFALLRQEHTAVVHAVDDAECPAADFTAPGTLVGDGLMTDRAGVLLAIGTADCVPVLLFDPVRQVVAAFHAGWRVTAARIVERGIAGMGLRYGSQPSDLLAAVGPAIGPASYVVAEELRTRFATQFEYAADLFAQRQGTGGSQLHLDLWQANRRQLLAAGVPADHIDVLAADTAADTERFFSHRAEHGRTGRMLSVIGLTA